MNTFDPAHPAVRKLIKDLTNPWKLSLYLFTKLPAAWFVGIRLRSLTPDEAKVSIKYGWRSQNPFKSIYFAAQCAAAEFSTGALAAMGVQGRGKISMLVAGMEAEFVKKAVSETTFTCRDGAKILEAIQRAIDTKEGQTVIGETIGTQGVNGEIVSRFRFTWTFKAK